MTDATATATNPFKKAAAAKKNAAPEFPNTPINGGDAAANGLDGQPVITVGNPQPAAANTQAPLPMPGGSPAPTLPTPGSGAASRGPEPTAADQPAGAGPLPTPQANPYAGPGTDAGDLPDDFVIDLTDVKSGGRDFIGVGRHLMVCQTVTQGFANSGNRKLVFSYLIVSGEYEGKRAQAHVALVESQWWKIDEHCRALGITNNDVRKPTLGQITKSGPGRLVIGEFIKGEPYNGTPQNDFSRVYPPDELGIKAGTTLEQARQEAAQG